MAGHLCIIMSYYGGLFKSATVREKRKDFGEDHSVKKITQLS